MTPDTEVSTSALARSTGLSARQMRRLKSTTVTVFVVAMVLVWVLPYLHLIFTSLKPPADAIGIPPTFIPNEFTLENYERILDEPGMGRAFLNSGLVAIFSTLLTLVLAVPAAYGVTFFKLRLGRVFLVFALITRMVPSVSIAVPLFSMMKDLDLLDTRTGLVLAHSTVSLPLAVWLMAAFFEPVPASLEEAARVDGCTRFGALRRIILPVVSGGIAVTAIFAFLASWNEFLFALMLTSIDAKTVPLAISEFNGQYGLEWGAMTALATLYSVPVVIFTLALQKRIIAGLTFGAVKG